MLGTGHAFVTACYNTCFVLREGKRCLLVDGGGGNGLLRQLERAGLDWRDMREIFVSHKHVDHLLGILWMIRMIGHYMTRGAYEGEAAIYGHGEVIGLLRDLADKLLTPSDTQWIGRRLHLISVEDGETRTLLGRPATFFDVGSTKARLFGFSMTLADGQRLVFCGDEPCTPRAEPYARGCDWLLHEAFRLYSQADRFQPYEKHHATVRDACVLAERLRVRHLILFHTEDQNLSQRRALYSAEGRRYFSGDLRIPDDLETIALS